MANTGWANVGFWDRLARVVFAVAGLVSRRWLGFVPSAATAAEVLGFALLVTALLAWDPVYALLSRSTLHRWR